MINQAKKIIGSAGLQQSLLLALGNVGASVFSAISLILFSRYMGPTAFGSFSVAFSLTQLTARLGDFGLNQATQKFIAPRYRDDAIAASKAIKLVGKIKAVVALLTIAIGFGFGPYLARQFFHVSDVRLIGLGIALSSVILFYEYFTVILQASARFTSAIMLNASQSIVKCILAILSFFSLNLGPVAAYIGYGLAPLISIAIGWMVIPKNLKQKVTNSFEVWPEIGRSAKFMGIGVLAAAIGDNIDVLMVNSSLTEYQTGLYSAAARIAMMATLVAMSFGTVFNTRIAQYNNAHHMSQFLKKALLFCIGSLGLIPIALLFSEPLLLLTAGSEFIGATPAMNYLIASSLVMMAIMPYIAVFYAVDYPAYFAIAGIIQTIVLIGANMMLIPAFGIDGAGMSKLIARIAVAGYTIVIAYRISRKQFNMSKS